MSKRIMIVGGGAEALDVLEKAASLGLRVVYVNKRKHFKDAYRDYVEQVVLMDYEDVDRLVTVARTLHHCWPCDGVISLTEASLVPAAHICEALGLLGNSVETVRLLKDKWRMRQRMAEVGLSPVTARVGANSEDLKRFLREVGSPIVAKPIDASGSLGIFRIASEEDAERAFNALGELGRSRFLMEEFLDGHEISVESLSFHGRHVIITATDKKITSDTCVEIGHAVPAALDDKTRAEVFELVTGFLNAVGLKEGPAHTEVKLTSKGPRIVESHNRNPGGRASELVTLACGVDMKKTALAWACGIGVPLERTPVPSGGAALRHIEPVGGHVREICGLDQIRTAEGYVDARVLVAVGDRVNPLRSGDDRIGHVIARGETVQQAVERADAMVHQIVLSIDHA